MLINPLIHPGSQSFAGRAVLLVDAQDQARTPRDVRGPWVRPKTPAKSRGRKGTRRAWKRRNPPHYIYFYREPTDVLMVAGKIVATPAQYRVLRSAALKDT